MGKRMTEENPAPNASFYLGFDGGGTKTDCILVDAEANVLARATAGPSNPLRAGYAKAWFTLSDAADVVLERHHLKAGDIRGICAGIGGAARESVAKRIATFLERAFPEAAVSVTTDLAITLNAAVGEKEGIILVVGTGSAAYGRDAQGYTARAGGRGPWFSDEGSAFDIGRRGVQAVALAEEHRGPETALSGRLFEFNQCRNWDQLGEQITKNADSVFPKTFALVAKVAEEGDAVARGILAEAAGSLAGLVVCVANELGWRDRDVSVAKVGGTNGRSKYFDAAIDGALKKAIPRVVNLPVELSPAEAAVRMAVRLGSA